MNDRFKFRVWDIESNKYIENEHVLFINPLTGNVFWDTMECELENVIIEQCTGLKDKNGLLIFEGDEVKWSDAFNSGQGFVEFCDSEFHHSFNYCGFGVRSEYTEKNLVHGKMQYGEKETQIHAFAKCCDYWLTGRSIHDEETQ